MEHKNFFRTAGFIIGHNLDKFPEEIRSELLEKLSEEESSI